MRPLPWLAACALLGGAVVAQAQQPPGQPPQSAPPSADRAPAATPPVEAGRLRDGLPRRDDGAAPNAAARTGPDTTSGTRLPPTGQDNPGGAGGTQPGPNPALGRGS